MQGQSTDFPVQLLHALHPRATPTVFVHRGYWDWVSNAKKPTW